MRFSPDSRFDRSLCTSCGTCSRVCPAGAVLLSREGIPQGFGRRCIGCGHCAAYCPEDCFSLGTPSGHSCSGAALSDLLASRRSCRFFRTDALSAGDLESLLSAVGYSPTGMNAQSVRVRVFNGREQVRVLSEQVRRFACRACRTGIPQLIAGFAGMAEELRRLRAGEDLVFREAPAVLFFHVPSGGNALARTDGVIAATMVMTFAETLGIATLWNGFAEVFYRLIRSWHGPDTAGTRLAAVLCAGYPSMKPLWKLPPREYSVSVTGEGI